MSTKYKNFNFLIWGFCIIFYLKKDNLFISQFYLNKKTKIKRYIKCIGVSNQTHLKTNIKALLTSNL